MRSKFSSINFDIVVGVDANVTLPLNSDEMTGEFVLTAAKTHTASMAGMILAWLAALEVRALNTLRSDECSVSGVKDDQRLWTCGTTRKPHKRT